MSKKKELEGTRLGILDKLLSFLDGHNAIRTINTLPTGCLSEERE